VEGKEVSAVEGILIDTADLGLAYGIVSGVFLLAVVICVTVLGYVADGEAEGNRFFWAEWPLPEADESVGPEEGEIRLAA
jgi:hypothetical protein